MTGSRQTANLLLSDLHASKSPGLVVAVICLHEYFFLFLSVCKITTGGMFL